MKYDPGRWVERLGREEALRREHEAQQEAYGRASEPDLLEAMRAHGSIEYDVGRVELQLQPRPQPRSRLTMLSGTKFYMEFSAPQPNGWRRFWTWALLGWIWTEIKPKE